MSKLFTDEHMEALTKAMSDNFLKVRVIVHKWNQSRRDKKEEALAAAAAGADPGALKVYKQALVGVDTEYKATSAAFERVRTAIDEVTLPYAMSGGDGRKTVGDRLTQADPVTLGHMYQTYASAKKKANDELDKLCEVWDDRINTALSKLGRTADRSLYPTVEELRHKFSVELVESVIPSTTDYSRLSLPPKMVSYMMQKAEKVGRTQVESSLNELRTRMLTELRRMATQLGNKGQEKKGTKLFPSLITNMENVVNMLEGMNVTESADIKNLIAEIRENLLDKSVEQYRANPTACLDASEHASKLADALDDVEWF